MNETESLHSGRSERCCICVAVCVCVWKKAIMCIVATRSHNVPQPEMCAIWMDIPVCMCVVVYRSSRLVYLLTLSLYMCIGQKYWIPQLNHISKHRQRATEPSCLVLGLSVRSSNERYTQKQRVYHTLEKSFYRIHNFPTRSSSWFFTVVGWRANTGMNVVNTQYSCFYIHLSYQYSLSVFEFFLCFCCCAFWMRNALKKKQKIAVVDC